MEKLGQNSPGSIKIHSQVDLQAWLAVQGIDCSEWGLGTTKTVDNLWTELVKGEILLVDNPPLRVVQVVQVVIRQGSRILIEVEQEFADKRRRARHYPPSEKMAAGESYVAAAMRCLKEELDVDRPRVELLLSTYQQRVSEKDSLSYPGLKSRYLFHVVEAKVEGLPSTEFWTLEDNVEPLDPVRKHHWVWQPQNEADWPD